MKAGLYTILVVLFILHHDFWYWNDSSLVFGFIPIGLAYHIAYSIAVAIAWALVLTYAWPDDLDRIGDAAE